MSRAERFVPININAFKRDLQRLADRTKKRVDKLVDGLPLHKKLEAFKALSPSEQIIYDFIYKDFNVVLGLKEDSDGA